MYRLWTYALARLKPGSRPRRHKVGPGSGPARERGATLIEYALILALLVGSTIGVILLLEDNSGSFLEQAGSDIGTPRGLAADFGLDESATPSWLTQPPAPAVYPTGSELVSGNMGSELNANLCFQAATPGTNGSLVDGGVSCSGGAAQEVVVTGTGTVAGIYFDSDSTRCVTDSGAYVTLEPCLDTDVQIWDLEIITGGPYTIYTFHSRSTGNCVNDAHPGGSMVTLLACDGSPQQQFGFE